MWPQWELREVRDTDNVVTLETPTTVTVPDDILEAAIVEAEIPRSPLVSIVYYLKLKYRFRPGFTRKLVHIFFPVP